MAGTYDFQNDDLPEEDPRDDEDEEYEENDQDGGVGLHLCGVRIWYCVRRIARSWGR